MVLTYHNLGLLNATLLEMVYQRLDRVRHVLVPDAPGRTVCTCEPTQMSGAVLINCLAALLPS